MVERCLRACKDLAREETHIIADIAIRVWRFESPNQDAKGCSRSCAMTYMIKVSTLVLKFKHALMIVNCTKCPSAAHIQLYVHTHTWTHPRACWFSAILICGQMQSYKQENQCVYVQDTFLLPQIKGHSGNPSWGPNLRDHVGISCEALDPTHTQTATVRSWKRKMWKVGFGQGGWGVRQKWRWARIIVNVSPLSCLFPPEWRHRSPCNLLCLHQEQMARILVTRYKCMERLRN